jgi:hypothetical protein
MLEKIPSRAVQHIIKEQENQNFSKDKIGKIADTSKYLKRNHSDSKSAKLIL